MLRSLSRVFCALFAAVAVAAAVLPTPANAQRPPLRSVFAPVVPTVDPLHAAGRDVTISLLTVGDGPLIWQMFGHTAIWIHDNTTARDTVFNWGAFDMTAPHFILHFVEGLNWYSIAGQPFDIILRESQYFNRTLRSQELDLTAAQKDSLLRLIAVNDEPANRLYRYDYFRDNCATRPRDFLDRVLGGRIRATSSQVTPWTYRAEALRKMQGDKPLVVGVDIGLGAPSDQPITEWQEMFLPERLHDFVAAMQVSDSTGAMHPLVKRETVLFQSTQPPEAQAPPKLGGLLLAIGIIVAAVLLWVGVLALPAGTMAGGVGIRVAAAVLFCLWSLVAGALGLVLVFLSQFSEHIFAHHNLNLFTFNPFWLVLAVLAPVALLRGRAGVWTVGATALLFAWSFVQLLLHVTTITHQQDLAIVALGLPPTLAILWVFSGRRRRRAYLHGENAIAG